MSAFQRSVMMAMGGGIDITTSSDAENVNLRTLLDAAGFDNDVPTIITYRLNSGVTITSAASTGTATPAWQTGTIGSIHTVLIYINGAVKGYGGAGGQRGADGEQHRRAGGDCGRRPPRDVRRDLLPVLRGAAASPRRAHALRRLRVPHPRDGGEIRPVAIPH